ncbi:hypothetical protein HN832_00955 [archaeon]|jgi:hypothetical protein|nr:hypothetical protein [archaeon]MBT4373780.1 hypothetical protein [archaeon]MBT4532246.1 hypothetical protein [archaeon]MBT7001071.1 hypothetical protein [archaeon]MBT7281960.1 hypothetical protein [archaeon]
MGWFTKDDDEGVPRLPELPKITELPKIPSREINNEKLPPLPSLPSNALGERFSQNMIKEAVSGEKEVEEEVDEEEPQMMPTLPTRPLTREIKTHEEIIPKRNIPSEFTEAIKRVRNEPIFIRIDKFEESLKIFEKTKERISEVAKMLQDIRKIKEEEENELTLWEEEIQNLKNQIEKIDEDIFSKIE